MWIFRGGVTRNLRCCPPVFLHGHQIEDISHFPSRKWEKPISTAEILDTRNPFQKCTQTPLLPTELSRQSILDLWDISVFQRDHVIIVHYPVTIDILVFDITGQDCALPNLSGAIPNIFLDFK